jgi:hypothetical protein
MYRDSLISGKEGFGYQFGVSGSDYDRDFFMDRAVITSYEGMRSGTDSKEFGWRERVCVITVRLDSLGMRSWSYSFRALLPPFFLTGG